MDLESKISELNSFFFFKEFSYSENKFKNDLNQEVEIADNIIYLDDISFIYQLKERTLQKRSDAKNEIKWFKKKVLTRATKQIRDTINYLTEYDRVELRNNKGHNVNISSADLSNLQKIVIYAPSGDLPKDYQNIKFHKSSTAGIIHIFKADEYKHVVNYLITPAEVAEYLYFRMAIIEKYGEHINEFSEFVLLGQYFSGYVDSAPSVDFFNYLKTLNTTTKEWDMTGIISLFQDRIIWSDGPTDYYYIIKELAKLMRNDLSIFKERFFCPGKLQKTINSLNRIDFIILVQIALFFFYLYLEKIRQ